MRPRRWRSVHLMLAVAVTLLLSAKSVRATRKCCADPEHVLLGDPEASGRMACGAPRSSLTPYVWTRQGSGVGAAGVPSACVQQQGNSSSVTVWVVHPPPSPQQQSNASAASATVYEEEEEEDNESSWRPPSRWREDEDFFCVDVLLTPSPSAVLVVVVGCDGGRGATNNATEVLLWTDVFNNDAEASRAPWSPPPPSSNASKMEEEEEEEEDAGALTVALPPAAPGTTLALRKCCPRGQWLNVELRACEPLRKGSATAFFPSWKTFSVEADEDGVVVLGSFPVAAATPPCPKHTARVFQVAPRIALRRRRRRRLHRGGGAAVDDDDDAEETCVDAASGNPAAAAVVVARCVSRDVACDASASAGGVCVSKCCPVGHSYVGKTCARSLHPLPLHFKRSFVDVRAPEGGAVAVVEGRPACAKVHPLEPSKREDDKWHLQQDGRVLRPAMSRLYTLDGYCLEHLNFSGMEPPRVLAFVCFPSRDANKHQSSSHDMGLPFPLRAAGLLLSVAALALTLLAYCLLPPLRNLFGKTVMATSASQLCAFLCLATAQLLSRQLRTGECKAIGYSIFFWFLTNFAWLNVVSFDIWWTFGALRGGRRQESCGGGGGGWGRGRGPPWRRRFALYSLYAWGLPAALSALTVCVNEFGEAWGVYHDLRPNIAVWDCFLLRGSLSRVLYLQIPLALMAAVNAVLFALTARRCWRVKAEIARLTGGRHMEQHSGSRTASSSINSSSNNNKKSKSNAGTTAQQPPQPPHQRKMAKFRGDCDRFLMNVKLLVAMGVPWVLDIISDFFIEPQWVWYITDMLLSLQGVYIFCIFVLKAKVLCRLRRRLAAFPCFRCCCFAASASGSAAVDSSPAAAASAAAHRGSTQRSLLAAAGASRFPAASNGKDQMHKTSSSSTLCTATTSVGGAGEPLALRHSPSPKQIAARVNK